MSRINKDVLNTEKAESLDDIHAVIGQMAAELLNAGRPLELTSLSDLLKQHAGQSADILLKKEYDDALSFLATKVPS